jgi:hypothetical protein
VEAGEAVKMADEIEVVVGAVYETSYLVSKAIREGAVGGAARADLHNTETWRGASAEPWGSGPVETFHTMLSFTILAMADHLRSTQQVMRADIDFGPMVTARCTTEAAGRVAWMLPQDDEADVRTRVGRGLALRLRGMRDNASNIAALVALEPEPSDELLANDAKAKVVIPEILTEAYGLGFKTHRNRENG